MNEPSDKTEVASEIASLKPRLIALVHGLRQSAAKEKQRADNAADTRLTEMLKQRAEVFEECAEALESLISSHERAIRTRQLDQFHADAPVKLARRPSRSRNNKTRIDRIVDAVVFLAFLMIIAGCGYLIVRLMTKWNVKGLGY